MSIWITIRSFLAFYVFLFGVAFMAGVPGIRALLGAALSAVGVTFFWRLWVAMRTGL